MNLLKSLFYGIISGIAEILPISSGGHQAVFRKIFGDSIHFGIYNIFVHIGLLVALLYACKPLLNRIRYAGSRVNRGGVSGDRRVIKDATPTFIIASAVVILTCSFDLSLLWISLLFVVNGVILFIPSCIATGNKDARSMSVLDSILIGFLGAVSVFPGLSRVGTMTTVISARGGDKQYGAIWALALSIPAMVVLIIADIYFAITQTIPFYFSQIFYYLFAFAGAFCGGCAAVRVLRRLAKRIGLSFLSYYSWGMAILAFLLYLMG